ncbi:MAG: penicillin-binding protein [Peptostreptococcaceae bacterium]|nr:penicillin-binding protein [Peptostreptococcaceae bacterium]
MRKVESRALACLLLAVILFFGLCYFIYKMAVNGEEWSTFKGNMNVYTDGQLSRGSIYDRNGEILIQCTKDGIIYSNDAEIRKATVHTVGDIYGNISNGLLNLKKGDLIGYSFINGIYSPDDTGNEIYLTLDANACEVAYNALGDHNGTVGVFNYETGEILCVVSKPTFDPMDIPDDPEDGTYYNKFIQGTMVPGSIFKLITAAAAIDSIDNLDEFSFDCDGSSEVEGDVINCTYAHGTVDFEEALAKSCNGAFGELSMEMGADKLEEYTDKAGLTNSYNIDGIMTKPSSFEFPSDTSVNLAWSGIGQYNDLINPCAMMVYMGAIANGGEAVEPSLIKRNSVKPNSLGNYLSEETADKIKDMMKNNVVETYGEENYPGLDIYAKSGTAEVVIGEQPNGWFVGFVKNEDYPYAFVVFVEKGGNGSTSAGPVARKTLEALIN